MTQKMPGLFYNARRCYTNAKRRESIDNVFIAVVVRLCVCVCVCERERIGRPNLLHLDRINIYHEYVFFLLPAFLPLFFLLSASVLRRCYVTL